MRKELLKFETSSCPQCRAMNSILDKVLKDYPDIILTKVDCEENPTMANDFNIKSIPTLVYMKDDVEYKRLVGITNALKEWLNT